jgi:hypothetical protein
MRLPVDLQFAIVLAFVAALLLIVCFNGVWGRVKRLSEEIERLRDDVRYMRQTLDEAMITGEREKTKRVRFGDDGELIETFNE